MAGGERARSKGLARAKCPPGGGAAKAGARGRRCVGVWQAWHPGGCALATFFRFGQRTELKPGNQEYPTLVITPDVDLEIRGVVDSLSRRGRA